MELDGKLHQRIQDFINHLGITNNQFAKEIGDSSAKISQVTSRSSRNPDFRVSFLLKILQRYPELSSDWLLTGEGPMLKDEEGQSIPLQSEVDGTPQPPVTGWKARLLAAQEEKSTIPLVEQKAYASYLAGHADADYLETRPVIYYPELKGLGPVIAIRVQGDSMSPTIYPDDVLLCSYVERGAKIQDYAVYVVCHTEGVVVKRIEDRSTDEQALHCISDNQEYPPFNINLPEIRHIWRVRRRITAFFDKSPALDMRLSEFQQQLADIRKQLAR